METVSAFGMPKGSIIFFSFLNFKFVNIYFFIFSFSLSKVNEVTVPTLVNTASLHRDKNMFVCGGEDLKMYKFDYTTGKEIGKCEILTAKHV